MKVLGKWDASDIEVRDKGMARYINLEPSSAPRGGKPSKERFKDNESIVERQINKLMRSGQNTGKKSKTAKIVRKAFEKIEEETGQNPVQVFVRAVENAGPREETVRLKYGGISVQKPVDTSPQRRVNVALNLIAKGVFQEAKKSRKNVHKILADEIIKASNYDRDSYAVKQKEETERVAAASR